MVDIMSMTFDDIPSDEQVGAVLIFKEGVDKAEAQRALTKLYDVLKYEPNVHTFDPKWGGPVWYIP